MKRKISTILILSIIISTFSVFSINTFADAEYDRLLVQSREYLGNKTSSFYYPLYSPALTVLLYTDAAKEFTFVREDITGHWVLSAERSWFVIGDYATSNCCLMSPEITAATESCATIPYKARESRSALREAVKYFDISKEELVEAFRKMKEDPDYIRPLLSFLSDEEYESSKLEDGTFGKTDWPEFVIEAMYIEDDAKAHDLLTYRNVVYIPELGRVTETNEIETAEYYLTFDERYHAEGYLTIDDLIKFDLTSDSMGLFIEHLRKRVDEDTAIEISEERMAMLEAAREYQLANPPQTGEALYLIPAALVSLALGVLVIYPRKKKNI